MNQETFEQIIQSGEIPTITPELLTAARESAHRHRTQAMRFGMAVLAKRIRSLFDHTRAHGIYAAEPCRPHAEVTC